MQASLSPVFVERHPVFGVRLGDRPFELVSREYTLGARQCPLQ